MCQAAVVTSLFRNPEKRAIHNIPVCLLSSFVLMASDHRTMVQVRGSSKEQRHRLLDPSGQYANSDLWYDRISRTLVRGANEQTKNNRSRGEIITDFPCNPIKDWV